MTTSEGEETVIIVDGQQRIATCLAFLTGDFQLGDASQLDERWRNRQFPDLDTVLKQRFRSYELILRKLPVLNDHILREIFLRLKWTVEALQPQELRHAAYTGDFIQFVEAAARVEVLSLTGVFTAADYRRRRNDELMAEIAMAVHSDAFPNKKDGLDELFLTFEKQGMPAGSLDLLRRKFGRVFQQLERNDRAIRRSRFRNKSDFYSLFVFLARMAERLPLPEGLTTEFDERLKEFSSLVNGTKQAEAVTPQAAVAQDPLSGEVVKYLRAVERAASDRLNRVRRDDALTAVSVRFWQLLQLAHWSRRTTNGSQVSLDLTMMIPRRQRGKTMALTCLRREPTCARSCGRQNRLRPWKDLPMARALRGVAAPRYS